MATEIRIPKLGLTMQEAGLNEWSVQSGQSVTAGQVLAILETDKVSFEVEAPTDGILLTLAEPGQTVAVAELIGYVAADQAEFDSLKSEAPAAAASAPAEKAPAASAADAASAAPAQAPAAPAAPGERVLASPLARAMAKENGLDLAAIPGSGPNGRVIKRDIEKVLKEGMPAAAPAKSAAAAPQPGGLLSVAREIPLSGVRKIIAQNMHLSLTSQAQLTLHTEASARGMQELRERYKAKGVKLSFNAIIAKAIAVALAQHPGLNASLDGEVIKLWNEVHVGIAMDVGNGLVVPKLRNAQAKPLTALAGELDDMVERAKQNRLGPDELQGGTITITNLGAWGIDHFTPIVNPPECAILGVGAIVDKPVAVEGGVAVEPRLALSLSFDHQVADGAYAAGFLKTLRDMLEEPLLMI